MSEKSKEFAKKLFKPSGIITILLIVLAVSLVVSSLFVVDESEQAVITRLGAYNKTLGSGLHMKLPFGIDKKYIVDGNKVVKTEQFGFRTSNSGVTNQYQNGITSESTMLTGDLNIVDVEWIIQYRITDPKAWLFSVEERTNTIRDISRLPAALRSPLRSLSLREPLQLPFLQNETANLFCRGGVRSSRDVR